MGLCIFKNKVNSSIGCLGGFSLSKTTNEAVHSFNLFFFLVVIREMLMYEVFLSVTSARSFLFSCYFAVSFF